MTAFSVAMDAIFADPNMATDAIYTPQGGFARAVRVILRRPDEVREYLDTRIVVDTVAIEVRVAEIAQPRDGDQVIIGSGPGTETYLVQGEPMRDALRLLWSLNLTPA